ncbi:DUF1223 domain-containing protein [Ferrovibrio sp.]|uniref:DUF1223 domain-containing protein n=1 Tax=Ferrovibrio sp. TaxID=1917215 RepID=UPI0035AE9D43
MILLRLRTLAAALLILAGFSGGIAHAGDKREAPIVVELFTSQGCSSCPPADALLHEWSRDPGVLVLSLHVDYWDYLGWKDTLSRPGHVKRQQAYARSTGSRQIYTPQAVIDGQYQVVGSNRAALKEAMQAARKDMRLALDVQRKPDGLPVAVKLPASANWIGEAVVWLCLFDRKRDVIIERGENTGRSITYVNVARSWQKLGLWDGGPVEIVLPDLADYDWHGSNGAILLQSTRGPILGVAELGHR